MTWWFCWRIVTYRWFAKLCAIFYQLWLLVESHKAYVKIFWSHVFFDKYFLKPCQTCKLILINSNLWSLFWTLYIVGLRCTLQIEWHLVALEFAILFLSQFEFLRFVDGIHGLEASCLRKCYWLVNSNQHLMIISPTSYSFSMPSLVGDLFILCFFSLFLISFMLIKEVYKRTRKKWVSWWYTQWFPWK